MKEIQIQIESDNDQVLMETVTLPHQVTLADYTDTCQFCDEETSNGDGLVYILRTSTEMNQNEVKQTQHHDHDPSVELRLPGRRASVITGRIGCYSNQATQQSWPVLLVPRLQLVVSSSTTTGEKTTAYPDNHDDPVDSLMLDIPQTTEYYHRREDTTTTEIPERQEMTLERWEQPPTATTEGDH